MKSKNMKNKIESFAKKELGKELAAGIDHFKRVYKIAKSLGPKNKLKYDDQILHAACFLHDIGEEPHQVEASKLAKKFLTGINFPKKKIQRVQEAILEHIPPGKPKSNEAILLHDADLIDFLGATGMVRLSIGAWDWMDKRSLRGILEVLKKFRKLAYRNLVLSKSKKLVRNKIKFMEKAIKQLERELT